jgi:hypothetical protein|tara:strand:- start:181 stop:696 length:516 start_codon:yes stop_codon:yes gene_type:complete
MASYKDYKSISAARKAGSLYYTNKEGKKMLAVTKEQLDSWKKKNKGLFKGSALTAYANAKGKNLSGAVKPKKKPLRSSLKPKTRPTSVKRITKAPKKIDPEVADIAKLTVIQIQKNPGMMSRLEQLQVELANLENRVAKAKKAGTLDRRATVQIPVVKRKIKNLKQKMKSK